MQDHHYVYYYLRSKDTDTARAGTPYYVGEGKNNRLTDKSHNVTVPKDPACIVKIAEGLTKQQAQRMEIMHIAMWGRKDLGTGILNNRTNGGDGVTGHSEETRMKMSAAKIGRRYVMSEQHKQAISRSRLGHEVTEETKQKLRERRAQQAISFHTEDAKSKISKKNSGEGNGMFGRKHPPEIIEKIREAGRKRHLLTRLAKGRGTE